MLRTGTSKNGRVYRYYTCSNCATKGKTVCKGRSVSMEKLDRLVTIICWNGFSSRNDLPPFWLPFLRGAPRRPKASMAD